MLSLNDKTFGGRYRLEDKVGVGGMAEVYKAFDTTLGRTVAIKVLHPQYAGEQDFIARFKREAQAAAHLNQPNIVNVHDWGAEDGTYYLVMEYLVGKNLKEIIVSEGPMDAARVIDIARQVAAALQFAHKHGIVHRDIKPQNIVITDEGEVKVTDFGIARSMDANVTQTASIMGTAHYLSPEQAKSDKVGAPSDIYSLGVVMYEMLTGRVPFEGDSPVSVALKHIQETPPAPGELIDDAPPELEAVIRKSMAKNPADRYAAAAELRDDLARLAAGLPAENTAVGDSDQTMAIPKPTWTEEPPPAPTETAVKKKNRRVGKIAGIIILLASLFVGSAFAANFVLDRTAKFDVPELVGKTPEEAKALLDESNLELKTGKTVFDDQAAAGVIVAQSPEPGKKAGRGDTVTVTLSKGKELVSVPNLRNKLLDQAYSALPKLGLDVGSIRRDYSDTVAEDNVIVQDPPAGGKASKGTYVNLVVSLGPRPQKTPNVIGKAVAEAKAIIAKEGLTVTTHEEFDDNTEAGEVISQSPAAGVPIKRDEAITITVSKGPELIDVPGVKGDEQADAKQALEAAGFTVKVSFSVTGPESYGSVVTQKPEAGTRSRRGSLITIWVGQEPADDLGGDT